MERIAIIDGMRTPFVKSWTLFDRIPAQDLGAIVLRDFLHKCDIDPALIDEVVFGCGGQPAEAINIARVIALKAGMPQSTIAYTVCRNCASGFDSVTSATDKIRSGVNTVMIAGGTESMSNIPLLFSKKSAALFMKLARAKTPGQKLGVLAQFRPAHFAPVPAMKLALTDSICGLNMGQTAEVLAKDFGISRKEQDEFALQSHQRAEAARESLQEEILPVPVPPDYKKIVTDDTGVREGQSIEALAKLRAVFERKTGTVTPGNSSQITDGACAILLMSETKARELGLEALGFLTDYVYKGLDPARMGLGPAFAIEEILRRNKLSLSDIGLIEINEAFAVQVLACLKALASEEFAKKHFPQGQAIGAINPDILNVNGGAIAIGHPIGTSGGRLIITCLKEMKRRNVKRGLVSLCIGGGQGSAIVLERD